MKKLIKKKIKNDIKHTPKGGHLDKPLKPTLVGFGSFSL